MEKRVLKDLCSAELEQPKFSLPGAEVPKQETASKHKAGGAPSGGEVSVESVQ